jgi:hypothetical protein
MREGAEELRDLGDQNRARVQERERVLRGYDRDQAGLGRRWGVAGLRRVGNGGDEFGELGLRRLQAAFESEEPVRLDGAGLRGRGGVRRRGRGLLGSWGELDRARWG